jgi:hypothetical protein
VPLSNLQVCGTLVEVLVNIDRAIGRGVVHSLLSDKHRHIKLKCCKGSQMTINLQTVEIPPKFYKSVCYCCHCYHSARTNDPQ